MSDKATQCQVCGKPRDKKLGLYCRACYNRAAYVRKYGTDEGYTPYTKQQPLDCANCNATIKKRHPNQNARRAAERRCKSEGCASKVATSYARYCAIHAPLAKRAVREHANQMLMPVVGRAEKLRREKEPQAVSVAVPPSIRVTVCEPIAPSFRDYIGNHEERPYQRRSRSGAAW